MAIVGSADPRIANVNKLKAAMPRLNVVAIEGATHSGARGAYTRPEFIQALQDFLKDKGGLAEAEERTR
jgi:hypothetical protein